MERFIESLDTATQKKTQTFKIQYGEIYRDPLNQLKLQRYKFKIQYGEIYRAIQDANTFFEKDLKSSMERFIESTKLKSLMI